MTDLNQYLESLLKNGACRTLGKPLFRYDDNTALRFPAAETDHAYQDSHAEAYKYLLDGLDKDTITRLGAHAGAMVNVSSDRAADALGKVLDPSIKDAVLEPFQKIVSVQRRLADHGVRPPAQRFKAFEQFNSDMEAIEAALNVLRDAVAKECAVTVESCVARSDAMKFLPEIDPGNPVYPNYSICQVTEAVGKTIDRVEFGFAKKREGSPEREVIILHFNDGGSLGIEMASNLGQILDRERPIQIGDCHLSYFITVVPPLHER